MQLIDKLNLIANCLDDKKGRRITALDVAELTSISDYFVICGAGSQSQVKALADNVCEKLSENGFEPIHIEGYRDATWVLIDYSDIVVHIFTDEMREFYDIERLWTDAKEVTLNLSDND